MWVLAALPAFAAPDRPCQEFRVGRDPIDGRVGSYRQWFDAFRFTGIELRLRGGAFTLHLTAFASGASENRGSAGDVAKIAVAGGVVELAAAHDTPPVAYVLDPEDVFTRWEVDYALTTEQLAALGSGRIEAIAVAVGSDEYRLAVVDGNPARLQRTFQCALTHVER